MILLFTFETQNCWTLKYQDKFQNDNYMLFKILQKQISGWLNDWVDEYK